MLHNFSIFYSTQPNKLLLYSLCSYLCRVIFKSWSQQVLSIWIQRPLWMNPTDQKTATFQRWIFPSIHSFLSFKLWHGTGVDKNPLPIWFEIWLQVHLVDLSGSRFLQIEDGCSVEDWSFWLKTSGILKHLMNPYQCQSLNNVYPKFTSQHANAY